MTYKALYSNYNNIMTILYHYNKHFLAQPLNGEIRLEAAGTISSYFQREILNLNAICQAIVEILPAVLFSVTLANCK